MLIVLGLGGYFGTGMSSPTALIPAAFGLVLAILGFLALKEHMRKHALHAASILALVGFVMPAYMALPKLPTLIATGQYIRDNGSNAAPAIVDQLNMATQCAAFLCLCINSFISARRLRRAETAKSTTP